MASFAQCGDCPSNNALKAEGTATLSNGAEGAAYDTDGLWLCATCGVGYEIGSGPMPCPICADDRQWLPTAGQCYTTLKELRSSRRNVMRQQEDGLYGIGIEPSFGIGQRCLLVQTEGGNVLWDCLPLLDNETIHAINKLGGLVAIALSHPHFIGTARAWAEAFGAKVYLHEADREWVPTSQACAFHFWGGEELSLADGGVKLVRVGGHFPGSAVAHVPRSKSDGKGLLLVGDTVFPVPHQQFLARKEELVSEPRWVSFMYSYPNLLPLPAAEVRQIKSSLGRLGFDRLYGAFWNLIISPTADECVRRSADRYLDAIEGRYHQK